MAFDAQRCVRDHWFTGQWDHIRLACREHLERVPGDREAIGLLAEVDLNLDRPGDGRGLAAGRPADHRRPLRGRFRHSALTEELERERSADRAREGAR